MHTEKTRETRYARKDCTLDVLMFRLAEAKKLLLSAVEGSEPEVGESE